MVYIVILLLVAGAGIGSLWVQQRRQRAHLDTSDSFRTSLEKIAPHANPGPFGRAAAQAGRRPASRRQVGRPVPMDPQRREAARRRVEARRRAALARAQRRSA